MLNDQLQAYQVETGDSGIAFKKTNRYINAEATLSDIRSTEGTFLVAYLPEAPDVAVGCVYLKFVASEKKTGH